MEEEREGRKTIVSFELTLSNLFLAGLSLRVRLLRSLPERYKVDIKVKAGTHQSENAGTFFLSLFFLLVELSSPPRLLLWF